MSHFCNFLGTSGAQAIAAGDLFEQSPSAVSESVVPPDLTTMQQHIEKKNVKKRRKKNQHIEKGAVTSGRGNGKMLGKIPMLRLRGTSITDRCTTQFYCFSSYVQLYESMKKTLLLLHQYTKSFMVSLIYEGLMISNSVYT